MTTTRRSFLATSALALAEASLTPLSFAAPIPRFANLAAALAQLEKSNNARLGVSVLDVATGERSGHRSAERFAMCSTFKMLLAAAILQRVDTRHEQLTHPIAIPAKPLVAYSPLTEEHAGDTMTVSALCHAILTRSDNTAANLLLDTIGGPTGITRFAQSIGDSITRLDRTETSLNEATPGDPRDTTSPDAMLANLRKLLLGDILSKSSRDQLTQWMIENKYGDERLRAALPPNWRAADKTGANGSTTTNDIALYWPPQGGPILVTAYLTECTGSEAHRNAILAEVGRLVITAFQVS